MAITQVLRYRLARTVKRLLRLDPSSQVLIELINRLRAMDGDQGENGEDLSFGAKTMVVLRGIEA